MKRFKIISNNPLVAENHHRLLTGSSFFEHNREKFQLDFQPETVQQVFSRAEKLMKSGWKLTTHPLPASGGLIGSPCRTLIMDEGESQFCRLEEEDLQVLKEAARRWQESRGEIISQSSSEELQAYRQLDLWSLESALQEIEKFISKSGGANSEAGSW